MKKILKSENPAHSFQEKNKSYSAVMKELPRFFSLILMGRTSLEIFFQGALSGP